MLKFNKLCVQAKVYLGVSLLHHCIIGSKYELW